MKNQGKAESVDPDGNLGILAFTLRAPQRICRRSIFPAFRLPLTAFLLILLSLGNQASGNFAYHSLFIKSGGSLHAMGSNSHGQLGTGNTTDQYSPSEIVASGVTQVSAGIHHSVFLRNDGSLWAMGQNSHGQLGTGNITDQYSPSEIVASGVTQVSAGLYHSLFLRNDGSLWAMGQNAQGQLGTGDTIDQHSPVQIIPSGVVQCAAHFHSLFLKIDGSLWAMGNNAFGQLGTGDAIQRNSPVRIVASGVRQIAAGERFSLFIKTDGSLWGMGRNDYGQLGAGNTTDQHSPVQIVASDVTQVATGSFHSLFLKTDGSLHCMGYNSQGELGTGDTVQQTSPVQILSSGVTQVAAGHYHSIFLKSDGSLHAMGLNTFGQLGNGGTTQQTSPVQVATGVIRLSEAVAPYFAQSAASLEMLWCPPGTFTMGSPTTETGRDSNETEHTVTLTKGFYLGKYEVTQAQYESVMTGNSNGLSATPSHYGGNPSRPVEHVSWDDAQVFLARLNETEQAAGRLPSGWSYVLPTESQWEYACRAGTNTAYWWGNAITAANSNYTGSGIGQTRDVGQYAANPWGFFDMHGNVWEWTSDWYQAAYPVGPVTDPSGATSGSKRAVRGGSWSNTGTEVRSAKRGSQALTRRGYALGFRLAFQYVGIPNSPPVITSLDGNASAALSIPENQTFATDVNASDADGNATVSYVISGEADAGKFDLNSTTGVLTFKNAPDFEAPMGGGGSITGLTVDSSGTGYTSAPIVNLVGGGGSGAQVTAAVFGGAVVSLTVVNPGTGYTSAPAVSFSGNGSGAVATAMISSGNNSYVVEVNATDGTAWDTQVITVNVTDLADTFHLSVVAGTGGSVSGGGIYGAGSSAAITATPSTGYYFTGWTGAGVTSPPTASTTVSMDQNRSVSANFALSQHSLTLTAGTGGAVSGAGTYTYGSIVNVTATPSNGYLFLNWTGSAVSDANASATTVTMDQNRSILANFVLAPDLDGDGLPDHQETNTGTFVDAGDAGTDPYNADTDGDGVKDGAEVSAGTDPTDQNDHPWDYTFGYKHINEAGAEAFLDSSSGMKKYSEWQTPPLTYWGPSANNAQSHLVYRFPLAGTVSKVFVKASASCWDFYNEPGGQGRGVARLQVSSDGASWSTAQDSLGPSNWGGDWSQNGVVAGGTGSSELWVRLTFLVEGSPNTTYTTAQTGRSDANAASNVFEVKAQYAPANAIPVITSDGGASLATVSLPENQVSVTGVAATDADTPTLTYSIVGGADQARFAIGPSDGVLTFQSPPDYENPADFNADNNYSVVVRVTDGTSHDLQTITVAVTDLSFEGTIGQALGPSPLAGDNFGAAVSHAGNLAAIGANNADPNGVSNAGLVSIFRMEYNGSMTHLSDASASDAVANNFFGNAVSFSGDLLAVAASYSSPGGKTEAGSAYVYRVESNGTATELAKLVAPDAVAGDKFGSSISQSGNLLAIGAVGADPNAKFQAGAAYVYRVESNNTVTFLQKITAPTPNQQDFFGNAIALSGNLLAVGAYSTDPSGKFDAGAAYMFRVEANGTVTHLSQLVSPDLAVGNRFGISVALTGTHLAVGSHWWNSRAGAVYLYQVDGAGGTTYLSRVITHDPGVNDYFGEALSLSPDYLSVGVRYADVNGQADSGAAYFYRLESNGTATFLNKFEAPTVAPDDKLGWSISQGGDHLLVGAPTTDSNGLVDAGAAYLFREASWGPNLPPAITSHDGNATAAFNLPENQAFAVDFNATDPDGDPLTFTISGGADAGRFDLNASTGILTFKNPPDFETPADADLDNSYIVDLNASDGAYSVTQTITITVTDLSFEGTITKIVAPDGVASDHFGHSVSQSGDILAVGASQADPGGLFGAGAAYVYKVEQNGSITHLSKLTAADGMADDQFGWSVSQSGEFLVVGAIGAAPGGLPDAGAAYAYRVEQNGSVTYLSKITAPDAVASDMFGASVSQSGGLLAVGANWADPGGNSAAGAAYLYKVEQNGSVNYLAKVTAPDGAANDKFGSSISQSGNVLAVGAPNADATYLYRVEQNGSATYLAKLTPPDGGSNTSFGYSVSQSEGILVVGASASDQGGYANNGAAYLYRVDQNGSVNYLAKARAPDEADDNQFGSSVTQFGDRLAVGALAADPGGLTDAGATYLFKVEQNGSITYLSKLTAPDGAASDLFGRSVSQFGDRLAVAATSADLGGAVHAGAVYLFHDPSWNQSPVVTSHDGNATVTFSIPENQAFSADFNATDLDGDPLAFTISGGADAARFDLNASTGVLTFKVIPNYEIPTDAGANNSYQVIVMVSDGDANATQAVTVGVTDILFEGTVNQIIAPDAASADEFGLAVSQSGDLLAIGADYADFNGQADAGVAYIYHLETNGSATYLTKVAASDASTGDYFGASVSLSGDLLAVGAASADSNGTTDAGAAYLFRVENNGTATSLAKVIAPDGLASDLFGSSVSQSGNLLAVGAPSADPNGQSNAGAAYLFRLESNGSVSFLTKVIAPAGSVDDEFGGQLSQSGNILAVGAYKSDHNGQADAGAIYLYRLESNGSATFLSKVNAPDAAANALFGSSLSQSGNLLAVGAYGDSPGGLTSAGAAYLFRVESNGSATFLSKVTAPDGVASDWFGKSVSQSGPLLAVGAWGADPNGMMSAGAAYLYRVESNGSATHLIKLTAPTPAMFDLFGVSVSQLDDRLAVGAYGASPNSVMQAGTVYFFQDSTWLPASPPTDLNLSSYTVVEGQPAGALVGNLHAVDPNPGDVHSFALVSGAGSSGNSFFAIQGDRLETNASLSRDANATLSIRVRVTDAATATFEKVLVINVASANSAPVFSSFDGNASVTLFRMENHSLVADLNATDADLDVLHFSVAGGLDASLFETNATSGRIQFRVAPDFEAPSDQGSDNLYLVEVEVSDGQVTATQSIAVSVQDDDSEDVDGDGLTEGEEEAIGTSDFNADTDGDGFSDYDETIVPSDPLDPTIVPNRPPSNISLSFAMVLENQPAGTLVGDFSTEDPDPEDSHQYALVSGAGGGDNPVFQVVGSSLRTLAYFDFESKNLYQIRVRSTDDEGLSLEQSLTIQVIDAFVPGVQTEQPTEVTAHSATLRGQLLDYGGLSLNERGFLLSRKPLPVEGADDTTLVTVSATDQNASFSAEAKDLVSGRRYYCRAFARNSEGTYYGETIRFATPFEKTIGIWSDAIAVDGAPDWYQSPWFGSAYLTGSNWIYHLELGWLYLGSSNRDDIWLWSSRVGWIWTGASLYPYLYRHDDASWVYFMGNEFNQLFFYRFSDSQWLSFGESEEKAPPQ